MANLNPDSIAGFDGMTAEQKVEALLKMEIPDEVDMSGFVAKEVFDRKATEAANLSKQLKAKADEAKALMTEEQQKQAALAEAAEADQREKEELRNRIAELEKSNTLREFTLSFSNLGFDEKLSVDTANALADGNSTKVFDNLKKFLDLYKKSIEADLISKTPRPDGAGIADTHTKNPALDYVKRRAAERAAIAKQAEEARNQFLKG